MYNIPWLNVTFENTSEDNDKSFILRYININPSYIYVGIYTDANVAINNIETYVDFFNNYKCGISILNKKTVYGRIDSDAKNGGTRSPPFRIIIFVKNVDDLDKVIGYFYVDIDVQGNVRLSI
jgi:hypothetical protein